MSSTDTPKTSFKQRMLQVREDAIIHAVNRLLAEKGFDAMTVDEEASEVGIAKASLYKHFPSKEDLAATAMLRLIRLAQDFISSLPMKPRRWRICALWCAGCWRSRSPETCRHCQVKIRACAPP
jgi:AcrR family transcriptional regulator